MSRLYRVLVIGENWHGSDCTGLARGFRELGHAVSLIGSDQFFPKNDRSFTSKAMGRLLGPFFRKQFNKYILKTSGAIKPQLAVVFKGNFVTPKTLMQLKQGGCWLTNFYPDTYFQGMRSLDTETFQHYEYIFTTKSFGPDGFRDYLGKDNVMYLPHGFDPSVHRKISHVNVPVDWHCDVSFVGTWSHKKERLIHDLVEKTDDISIKIWGNQWEKNTSKKVAPLIIGHAIYGDYYAMAIGSSRINLALLIDKRGNARSGDQITSRTFHIPSSGGFMLHERTDDVLEYFEEGKEIACFGSSEELIEKVNYYLAHEKEREKIARLGYERCIQENSLAHRAQVIIDKYNYMKNSVK